MKERKSNKKTILVYIVALAIVALWTRGAWKGGANASSDDIYDTLSSVDILQDVADYEACTTTASAQTQRIVGAVTPAQGYEIPLGAASSPSQTLKRTGYTASYNSDTRLPNWVAWHLTADRSIGTANRDNYDFTEDAEVASPRAQDTDYYSKGYDRGHMCPAGDNKWSDKAMEQSFLFTNICPQSPQLNRGDWNEIENTCREWARTYGDIYIACGPLLSDSKHKTIGKNKVVVPEAFFKVVLRLGDNPAAIAFICENGSQNGNMSDYVHTVDELEEMTGMDFFHSLPDDIEKKVEAIADISDW